ncbi:MAG: Mur ligase domain-containing protein, partial [Mycobacterium sp.]
MITRLFGRRAHLIGIGGAGMGGVARLLLSHGVAVSGS